MEHRLIGLVGGEGKKGAVEIAKVLTAQIAANNCYTDVKLVYIYNDDDSDDLDRWGFAKWLPHVWSEDKKFRYVASSRTEASDVFYEITNVLRQRTENPEKKGGIEVPWFVMFISDISMIENELIAKYIFDNNGDYGLSVLILSDTFTQFASPLMKKLATNISLRPSRWKRPTMTGSSLFSHLSPTPSRRTGSPMTRRAM